MAVARRGCGIVIFSVLLLMFACTKATAAEPKWKWILMDVYWNKSGGQVCEFRRIGASERARIVRKRGYGCPNKSMNPYKES